MDQILAAGVDILSFIMLFVIAWFTYTIINIVVTIVRTRKLDNSLTFCFNTLGKVFYTCLTIVYLVSVIGGLYFIITGLLNNHIDYYRNAVNVIAFVSVVVAFFLSSLVLVGRKNLMVGRMVIDYRKLKKINYSYTNKVSFVYAQKEYNFSSRFIDLTEFRKRISK